MAHYRATYHHGDARAALTQAAFDLARGGGPPMVTLRAAARDVGITAAAVYRHFTTVEELLDAVKRRSLSMLAQQLDAAIAPLGADARGEHEYAQAHTQVGHAEHMQAHADPADDADSDHDLGRADPDCIDGADHEHTHAAHADRADGNGAADYEHDRTWQSHADREQDRAERSHAADSDHDLGRADPDRTIDPEHHRPERSYADHGHAERDRAGPGVGSAGGVVAARLRIRAVAESYLSFAREYPGLFGMACHGGVDAACDLVAERVGGVSRAVGLAVWSAAHGVAALTGSEAEQQQVLDIVLAGIVPD